MIAAATLARAGSDHATTLGGDLGQMAWASLGLCALAALSLARAGWRRSPPDPPLLGWQLKLTHLLPASIQLLIYAYWGLYWRALPSFLPLIALQLVWAFALDALVAALRHGRWVVRVGPVPIVLSANLIVLFEAKAWPLSVLAVTVALLSRDLLRIGGRHVFNPSALGVSAVAVLHLLLPTLGYSDRAHEFDLPPNMTEVVILLALVVQLRLPVVLVTFGAAASLWTLQWLGLHALSPSWAPVTLVLLLFLTDPATTPRSAPGRLLFGLLAGALMGLFGHGLELLGYSDFYAKVLALPPANAATPWLDRAGRWLTARWAGLGRWLQPRRNLAHVALWLVCVVAALAGERKSHRLDTPAAEMMHRENRSRFLVLRDGRPRCADNPLYCQTFRFDLELKAWLGRGRRSPGARSDRAAAER